jgi:ankyrin repeat protein
MNKITIILPAVLLLNCSILTSKQTSPIFQEVRSGNTQAIKERVRNCENCAEKDENGNTPLHVAAQEGQTEIVEVLTTELEKGGWFYSWWYGEATLPDKNEKNRDGNTALHCAMESGHLHAAECLLKKNVNPTITNDETLIPAFVLMKHDNQELINFLIKHRLLEQRGYNGDNALHYALKHNKRRVAERLAEMRTMTEGRNNEGKTAAIVATDLNSLEALNLLRSKGVDLNAPGDHGCRPIHNAAMRGNYEAVQYLLEQSVFIDSADEYGNTPLLIATINNKEHIINLLLTRKANTGARNNAGKDIFSLATEHKHFNLMDRFKNEVDINARDNNGQTALMRAAERREVEVMSSLLSYGAKTNIIDNTYENVLHKIARSGNENGLALVITSNPDLLTGPNANGDLPLFIALQNGQSQIAHILIDHNASALQASNKNGETALHQACKSKNIKALKEVLSSPNRPAIELPDKDGFTPLHYAAAYDNVDAMNELMGYGASLTAYAKDGYSIGHVAAENNAVNVIKFCKKYNPSMQERNKNNQTPFLVAVIKGNVDAAKLLLCEQDFISRDMSLARKHARENGHSAVTRFLDEQDSARWEECKKIAQQPEDTIQLYEKANHLHNRLLSQNILYGFEYQQYNTHSLKRYSTDDLYHMTEAERSRISLEYTKQFNDIASVTIKLEERLHSIKMKQEQEKQQQILEQQRIANQQRRESERLRQEKEMREQQQAYQAMNEQHKKLERIRLHNEAEQKKALDAIATQKKQAEEYKLINDQQKEFERIRLQNEAEEKARLAAFKEQQEELKKLNEQKVALDEVAAQKKELDHYAAQKHADALEKQQPHVPFNLQASAPPMEIAAIAHQCLACGNKVPVKPLPCVKCKKKIQDICLQCIKTHKGRCPECWDILAHGMEKAKGECCIGTAACTEEKGVTLIPCIECKKDSSTARICPPCLQACIKKNKELRQPHHCPHCGKNTLDETLIQKIFSQK